ncbi:MAG: 3'-5' exoribonuclease YhaM family protein [Christensenellales bacterium]|jgi:3'-5' exoribonuclease
MTEQDFIRIQDFKKGDTATGFYIVRNSALKTSANNRNYGDLTLGDASGEINAKIWTVPPEGLPNVGDFIKTQGLVTEWQGKLQYRIDKFRQVREGDPVDMEQMTPSAPESPEAMLLEIEGYAARIRNIDIKSIVLLLLDRHREALSYYPAALRNHHSIRSGLAYHTLSMLRVADGILKVYDFLNADLVYGGVILHDIAKIDELEAGTGGIASQYTAPGQLLGHITQGILMVGKAGEQLGCDPEIVTLLQHMILSHHYEPEYGSPKRPAFPEAEVLHYLDVLDARMFDMRRILEDQQPGTFSEIIWTLHNRKLYRTVFDAPEAPENEQ